MTEPEVRVLTWQVMEFRDLLADDRSMAGIERDSVDTVNTDIFETDTAIAPTAEHRYAANLSDRFDRLGGGPLGGYTLAVGVRALQASMPHPDAVVIAASFLKPAVHGPVDMAVEIERAGRRVSTGRLVLQQNGKPVMSVMGTFADLDSESGRTESFVDAPDLPPADDCIDPLDGLELAGATIRDRVDYRFVTVPGWRDGNPSGDPSAELWMRMAGGRTADAAALCLLVDACAPMVLDIGELGSSTLQLTVSLHQRVADGWLQCRASTSHVVNGHHDEDFEIFDIDGNLVARSRQHAILG